MLAETQNKNQCLQALTLVLRARGCVATLMRTLDRLGCPPLTKEEEGAYMLRWMESIGELRGLKRLE